MYQYKERQDILDNFMKNCLTNVALLQEKNKKTVFTIASTATKNKDFLMPYATPVRKTDYFNIAGCIVYTQAQALLVAKAIDGHVDSIVVDNEKKIPIQVEPEISFLPKDLQEITLGAEKTISNIETGNLTSVCYEAIKKSKMYKFKPNDMTVDAIFGFLEQKFPILSGKKISIIGAGNIGTKLALKCVEVGANVSIHRSNHFKGEKIVTALNYIKSSSVISDVSYCDDIMKATFMSDVIIGTTDFGIIDWEYIAAAKKDVLLIDAGKGSFNIDAIEKCIKLGLKIIRTDITAFLEGYLVSLFKQEDLINNVMGKVTKNNITFISGGLLGSFEDVIVDNYMNPTFIIGLADGKGDLIRNLSDEQTELINKAKGMLK